MKILPLLAGNRFLRKVLFAFFIFFLGYPAFASAANYYVSTTGNDSAAGTLVAPWRTVTYAASRAAAGDTVYIRGGTYNEESINPANSGTSGSPITFTRYQSEVPVIRGSSDRGTFFIQGRQYIVLDHLTIVGGAAGVHLAYDSAVNNITIQYCDISGWTGGDNNGGIFINSTGHSNNILIQFNYIHDSLGNIGGSAGVIIFQASTVTIRNNEFSRAGHGIYYKHSHDDYSITTIENNYFHNNQNLAAGWSRRNVVFRNNLARDNDGAIRIFEESAGCANLYSDHSTIIHNTFVSTGGIKLNREGGFGCPGSIETTLRDNLLYGAVDTEYNALSVFVYTYANMLYPPDGHTRASYNLIHNTSSATPVKVNGSSYTVSAAPLTENTANIQAAPTFVNYANRTASTSNLALAAGSAGKNAASDGSDLGANVNLVGITSGSLPPPPTPTPAPSWPSIMGITPAQ